MDEKDSEQLKLDRERLDFEREKFRFEEAKRFEELEKLKAERRKTELEAADLEVPYKERPAYKATVFQGIAVLVAVISAVISVGTLEKVLEAYKADQARNAAEAQVKQAKTDQAAAEKAEHDATEERNAANSNIAELHKQMDPLKLEYESTTRDLEAKKQQVDEFQSKLQNEQLNEQRNVALAPIKAILSGSGNSGQVAEALAVAPDPFNEEREEYVKAIAFGSKASVEYRFALLEVLYEHENHKSTPDIIKTQEYRNHFISLATPLVSDDLSNWKSLTSFVGADSAAPYICNEYKHHNWPSDGSSLQRIGYAQFIVERFYNHDECLGALWDTIDLGLIKDPKLWNTFVPYVEINLARCAYKADLCPLDDRRIWIGHSLDLMNMLDLPLEGAPGTLRPLLTGHLLEFKERLKIINKWGDQNPFLVSVLTEPGLIRLRRCGMPIWMSIKNGQYLSEETIRRRCSISD